MVDSSSLVVPVTLVLLYGLVFVVAGVSLLTVVRNLQAGRRRLRWRKWWRRAAAPEPGAERQAAGHRNPQCEPQCPCSEADQELQQLVLSGLPKRRPVLSADFLQAAWRDLEELVERNSLSCQCCSSPEVQNCPGKGNVDSQKVPGRAPAEPVPVCSPGSVWYAEIHKALRMHLARKSLEVHLGALPKLLVLSQQQAMGTQGRRILPKLIKPGQTQPLRRQRLCPSLQAKADRIAGNLLQKHETREWGVPNPTELSLYRLVPCPPYLVLPRKQGLDGKTIQRKAQAHSQGQAEAQEHPKKTEQCRPQESAKIPLPPSQEAAKKQERPTATAALPGLANTSQLKNASCQTDSAGLHVTDIKARSQRLSTALDVISKLHLSQGAFGKLSMHTARKCLEVKLQYFPATLQRSVQQQREAPLTCPAGSRAPRSRPVRRYFHSCQALFLNDETREDLELHIRSVKLERLENRPISGSPLKPAVPQEEESNSTYVTAPSEAAWAEAGPKGHQWKKSPSRGKSNRSAKEECGSFPSARVTFCGVQEKATTYRSSLLQPCTDPDSDRTSLAANKKVCGKICVMPQKPQARASKLIRLACKVRKSKAR